MRLRRSIEEEKNFHMIAYGATWSNRKIIYVLHRLKFCASTQQTAAATEIVVCIESGTIQTKK